MLQVGSSASLWLLPQAAGRYMRATCWLVVNGCHQFYFPIYWEFHHPNWLPYFFRLTFGTRFFFLRLQDFKDATSLDKPSAIRLEASQLLLSGDPRWPKAPSRFANRGTGEDIKQFIWHIMTWNQWSLTQSDMMCVEAKLKIHIIRQTVARRHKRKGRETPGKLGLWTLWTSNRTQTVRNSSWLHASGRCCHCSPAEIQLQLGSVSFGWCPFRYHHYHSGVLCGRLLTLMTKFMMLLTTFS